MIIFEWLANYLLHSSLLLLLALASGRLSILRNPSIQDLIWKSALLAGVLTAAVQTASPLGSPFRLGARLAAPPPVQVGTSGAAQLAEPTPPLPSPAVAPPAAVESTMGSSSPAAASAVPPGPGWPALGLAAWCLGSLLLLVNLLRDLAAERRLLAGRRRIAGNERQELIGRLAWPPATRLSASATIETPVATRGREIVVPESFARMPGGQREAILAHELGHIERCDPQWRIAVRLLNALLFVQPINRIAERRLVATAEFLSDRYALARTNCARKLLAVSLASYAEQTTGFRTACAAVTSGNLVERLERLLADRSLRLPTAAEFIAMLAVTAGAGAALLPGISTGARAGDPSKSLHSMSVRGEGEAVEIHVSHSDRHRRIELDAEGRLEFSSDYSDITGISPGGYLDLKVTEDGRTSRLEIEHGNGSATRRFSIDGVEQSDDADARRWLAIYLPEIFRATGIEANGRVAHLLENGGVERVMSEIEMIRGDLVARIYAEQLVRQAELDDAQLAVLIETLVAGIDSDLELRLALAALMGTQALDEQRWGLLLEATEAIGSDLEQRLVLGTAAARLPPTRALVNAYVEATGRIGSDLEQRLSLEAIAGHLGNADEHLLIRVLEGARHIGSDLELRLLLGTIAPALDSPGGYQAYLAAAEHVGSDLEARLAYAALLDGQPDARIAASIASAAATSIGSDLELSLLLRQLLDRYEDDPTVRNAVVEASAAIGSELERNRVLGRVVR